MDQNNNFNQMDNNQNFNPIDNNPNLAGDNLNNVGEQNVQETNMNQVVNEQPVVQTEPVINQPEPQMTNSFDNTFASSNTTQEVVTNTPNQGEKKKNNAALFIILFVLLIGIGVFLFFMLKPSSGSSNGDGDYYDADYITIDVPVPIDVQMEEPELTKEYYTLVYDKNNIVKNIIMTLFYSDEKVAKRDYDLDKKNNSKSNYEFKAKVLQLDGKTYTIVYEESTLENYYDDYYGVSIDEIKAYNNYKEVKDFVPNVSKEYLRLKSETKKIDNKDSDEEISKSDKEEMLKQVKEAFEASFNDNYNELHNINYSYYVTIDEKSIKYTHQEIIIM